MKRSILPQGFTPRKPATMLLALAVSLAAFIPLAYSAASEQPAKKAKAEAKAKPGAQKPVKEVTLQAITPGLRMPGSAQDDEEIGARVARRQSPEAARAERRVPREFRLRRARQWDGDLSTLPQTAPEKIDRPEREGPDPAPQEAPAPRGARARGFLDQPTSLDVAGIEPTLSAPAPSPIANFAGLDFQNFGNGHPPDTVGDVGPNHYIQAINTSLGIYDKSTGTRLAAFSFNTFMSQGNFGNLCDTNNFGDPIVMYDTFEDRWIVTDFAFGLTGGAVNNPPGAFECFAVSKTGDPVAGGWNFYYIQVTDFLNDYPKMGVWPDGIYMSANMFGFPSGGAFAGPRVWALNKAQMYAGAPSVQIVSFNAPIADFTILPSNARLQSGTPPAGTPNYFLSTWEYTNALTVYKFHVDWASIGLSTFTGPDVPIAATSWPNATVANAPSQGGNALDVLQIRAMMQNQYSNLSGVESLWASHTVRRGNTTGFAAPRWYQVDVTGGTVNPNIPQAATWDPDAANVIYRFMPSLAVNKNGDMAIGYSTSSSTSRPALKYAGRLAGDPVNTLGQTEQLLIQGAGTQVGNCGTSACTRWGDYSAMSLDPNGCTFWFTSMYYAVDGLDHQTRIGSFEFPGCTPVGAGGVLQGTVTRVSDGSPISGAVVSLGSRSTTTDGSGLYSLGVPAGTYATVTASYPGLTSATGSNIVITDGGTTVQNLALNAAPLSACLTDTAQGDFLGGVATNCDLNTTPGSITLNNAPNSDQQNTTLSTSGVGITATTFGGQTFTPALNGTLLKADINLFCNLCTGTFPNLTLSVRATSGGLPTGADLATSTIAGFNSGAGGDYTGIFVTPLAVTAGTTYALVIRPTANPSAGTYALTRSATNVYAGGQRVAGATSGTVWSAPLTSGQTTDVGFKTYIDVGYSSPGTFVSSAKDANPAAGEVVSWGALSWTATTPAGTDVKFQAASSDSAAGVFNFVGPDGTASTYFTNGASLAQFSGKRYLKYKAYLTTSSSASTPTLQDVTVCFQRLVPSVVATGDLVIREFRSRGPGGALDEFVKVFNKSATSVVVGAADASNGFGIVGANTGACSGTSALLATIPNGTVIPSGGFFLAANSSGYSLANYGGLNAAQQDASWTTDFCDNSGVGLFKSSTTFDTTTRLDAAGFVGSVAPFLEGTGIPVAGSTGTAEVTYVRKAAAAVQDTGDNATDFWLVDTVSGTYGAITARLGAPGPQNLSSEREKGLIFTLADPAKTATTFPNRYRVGTGPTGTYFFRWKVTNNTGAAITSLRIRVQNVTTLNSPGYTPGVTQADFRFVTSADSAPFTVPVDGSVVAKGLTLQPPPTSLPQNGGYNASGFVTLPGGTLANGASVYVDAAMFYVRAGGYSYFISAEAK
ncbi:MAG: carboxypeptidase regulatory-like domain-containing protein [Vicinamibacteria bacterium]